MIPRSVDVHAKKMDSKLLPVLPTGSALREAPAIVFSHRCRQAAVVTVKCTYVSW